ncbi:MAG: hypothetical protein IJY62_00555 [Clostridia bacterium]|nr:hypothetical protein [Clostridia bacterium]
MNKTQEYLNEIRALDGLKNAIIGGIAVERKVMSAEFTLITDKAYTSAEATQAEQITGKYLPAAFSPRLKIVKRVPDAEILRKRIFDFMTARFPAAAAFLKEEDIEIEMLSSGANFCFDVASGEQELFGSGKILDEVSAYLKTVYCGSFYGNVRIVEQERDDSLLNDAPIVEEEEALRARYFPIVNFKKLDGVDETPKFAKYIADVNEKEDDLTLCGAIGFIQERESKKGKAYYTITLSDGTGTIRVSYFPKKATVERIRELKTGDWVVLSGANEEFNGNLSYTAKKINFGTPPEGFVPEKREGRPVPNAYHVVFPEPYEDYTQAGFFDDLSKPDELKNNVFVVFDLETTGLNNQPAMGKMDRIIELGAVKIVNGTVTEKFSSFVACPDRLSPEIVELTGIRDEDLIGAPTVDKVLADFYKFADGAYLVGHNVQFDFRFVKYYGEECRFFFEHTTLDTLNLAQEILRGQLANYKLNTIADHYGFTFNHHRAFDDALTTAKIFIELIKAKGRL